MRVQSLNKDGRKRGKKWCRRKKKEESITTSHMETSRRCLRSIANRGTRPTLLCRKSIHSPLRNHLLYPVSSRRTRNPTKLRRAIAKYFYRNYLSVNVTQKYVINFPLSRVTCFYNFQSSSRIRCLLCIDVAR